MTTDLTRSTAAELADLLAQGSVSAREVAQAHLDRTAAVDGDVHSYLHVDAEGALAQADAVDRRRAAGESLHRLAGVPIAVKDVMATQGLPTTCGSRILQGWVPPYDATLVTRLREAGMPILGKTNMDEFAMGSSTEHSAYGPSHNPWDLERIPGGSGGGSSSVVASFQAPLAIGTDTGGSIRQPAAVTGTVGTKPTYGGVSRYGLVALASSLDQAGPCTRTVLDAALLHEVIAGHDPMDSTSIDAPVPPVVEAARRADVKGLRIGIVRELDRRGLPGRGADPLRRGRAAPGRRRRRGRRGLVPELHLRAGRLLPDPAERGVEQPRQVRRHALRPAGAPDGVDAPSAEQVMAATRDAGFGDEVKRRIILGTYALSTGYYDAYYGSAQKVRRLIANDFTAAFEQADVLVSPTAPTTAFKLGDKLDDPMAMYLNDIATIPANLAGIPGMSVPSGLAPEDGLPTGFQVLAPAMRDDRLYAVGAALEARLTAAWGGPILDRAPVLGARRTTTTTTKEA